MRLARRLVYTWAFNIAAIFVASAFVDGVDYAGDLWILILAAAVFGFGSALVKPVVKVAAFPLVILSFGLVLLLVNVLMLYVTTWIVHDFTIRTFRDGLLGSIVIWLVNLGLNLVFDRKSKRRR